MLAFLLLVGVAVAIPVQNSVTYQDSFARGRMLPASAAAYSKKPADCLTNAFPNTELKRQLEVVCDLSLIDKCSGFTAVDHDEQAIIIAYRGTNQPLELINESRQTVLKNHTSWVAGGQVSKFFFDGFTRLWNKGMKDDYLSLKNQYPGYQVWVTGHSLGGSLAVLAASYLSHNQIVNPTQLTLVTFGEPRTGDAQFAASVDKDVPNAFRVTHAHDPVPHVPLENMEGYLHHKSEVFYHEDMSVGAPFTVCSDENESKKCSDGQLLDTNINDHLRYFNQHISEFGDHGCK